MENRVTLFALTTLFADGWLANRSCQTAAFTSPSHSGRQEAWGASSNPGPGLRLGLVKSPKKLQFNQININPNTDCSEIFLDSLNHFVFCEKNDLSQNVSRIWTPYFGLGCPVALCLGVRFQHHDPSFTQQKRWNAKQGTAMISHSIWMAAGNSFGRENLHPKKNVPKNISNKIINPA